MPVFTPLQIEKLVTLAKQKRIAPVYLFIGEEEICREKAKQILEILKNQNAIVETYDLKNKEDLTTFLSLRGLQESLFGIRKIYLVLGGENIPEEKGEKLINTLKNLPTIFTWFLIAQEMQESHPIYQYAMEKGAIVPFVGKRQEDLFESELIMKLKENNKFMDKHTANLFLSLVGKDYNHFKNELEKLLLYSYKEQYITEEDVLKVTVAVESGALYLLSDTLFNKGPHKAFELVLHLLDSKIEPPVILGYLYRYFKRMVILKEFLKKHPELEKEERYSTFSQKLKEIKDNPLEEIPKVIAEVHPYPLYNMKRNLKRIKNFKNIFEILYKADTSLKRDFFQPVRVFNQLIFSLWQEIKES